MAISIPLFSPDHLDTLEGISADMFDENEYSEYLTGVRLYEDCEAGMLVVVL